MFVGVSHAHYDASQSSERSHPDIQMDVAIITCSIQDACRVSGLGRNKIYEAIANRELRPIRIGRRTLVNYEQLKSWLESKAAA